MRTKISFQDARYLMFLFAPSDLGHWYPMAGIKELPEEIRRQALLDGARRIYNDNGIGASPPSDYSTQENHRTNIDHESEEIMEGFADLVAMLCKLSKADNHISVEEINIIDSFFNDILKLSDKQRRQAVKYFNNTKVSDTYFEVYAQRFFQCHRNNKELLEGICSLLTTLALADGVLSAEEDILINQAINIFGVDGNAYYEFKNTKKYKEQSKEKKYAKILGLDGDITHEKARQAYRRLAHKYHPDKVSPLGDKMREIAEHEMKLINEAYEYFKSNYAH